MFYPKPCYNEPCYKEVVVYLTILYTKLSGIDTVSRESTLSKLFLCQSAKGTLKEKF